MGLYVEIQMSVHKPHIHVIPMHTVTTRKEPITAPVTLDIMETDPIVKVSVSLNNW